MTEKINVGLWRPSILLPTPMQSNRWISSGRVPLHKKDRKMKYINIAVNRNQNLHILKTSTKCHTDIQALPENVAKEYHKGHRNPSLPPWIGYQTNSLAVCYMLHNVTNFINITNICKISKRTNNCEVMASFNPTNRIIFGFLLSPQRRHGIRQVAFPHIKSISSNFINYSSFSNKLNQGVCI